MVFLRMTWALAASILFLEVSTILAQHQIVCSGQAAGGYAAFPDVCRLPNGELFCVFYSGYGHVSTPSAKWPKGGRIMAVRSSDNGQIWSRPFVVIDTDQDDRDPSVASSKMGRSSSTGLRSSKAELRSYLLARRTKEKPGVSRSSSPWILLARSPAHHQCENCLMAR